MYQKTRAVCMRALAALGTAGASQARMAVLTLLVTLLFTGAACAPRYPSGSASPLTIRPVSARRLAEKACRCCTTP